MSYCSHCLKRMMMYLKRSAISEVIQWKDSRESVCFSCVHDALTASYAKTLGTLSPIPPQGHHALDLICRSISMLLRKKIKRCRSKNLVLQMGGARGSGIAKIRQWHSRLPEGKMLDRMPLWRGWWYVPPNRRGGCPKGKACGAKPACTETLKVLRFCGRDTI